jgi:acetyltransferase-like isoleucine patch superfamily enzyme
MAWMTNKEISDMNCKAIGTDVLISDRAVIHNPETTEIGNNSRIDDFCILSGKIVLGKNVHIAVFCNLAGGSEGIEMNDFSGLAYNCQLFTQSDDYSGDTLTNPTIPEKYKNVYRNKIVIGRHVIIGCSSMVFPGVSIGEGCSIGAGSIVNKGLEPWGIYVGSPVRRIKDRQRKLLLLEKEYTNGNDY